MSTISSLLLRLLLVAASLGAGPARAWKTRGVLQPVAGTRFIYVGKFCFDFYKPPSEYAHDISQWRAAGALRIAVEGRVRGKTGWDGEKYNGKKKDLPSLPAFPPTRGSLYLAVFSDAEDQWQTVRQRWENISADELLDRAVTVRAVTPILPAGHFAANVFVSETTRPRFLYFTFVFWDTVVDANSMPVFYAIHAQNLLNGYEKEFSKDEQGGIRLHVTGALAFGLVLVGVLVAFKMTYGEVGLWSKPLLKILLLSCLLSCVACSIRLVHETSYARNGKGHRWSEVYGELSASLARLLLTALQLYIANGKALFMGTEMKKRRVYLSALIGGIVLMSLGCEVYARYFNDMDWSTTLYFYESWPGNLILLFNCLIFIDVCRSTYRLYKKPETSKAVQRFYTYTFIAASIYFATLPFMCILAVKLHPWNRKHVVVATELGVRFVTTVFLMWVLRPSRLDTMINARLETQEKRGVAMELSDKLSLGGELGDGMGGASTGAVAAGPH